MAEPAPKARPATGGGGSGFVPPPARSLPTVLSKDEVRALISAPIGVHAVRDRCILATLFFSACRVSELVGMEWEGVDYARGRMRFWRIKNRSWHEVTMDPKWLASLEALRRFGRLHTARGAIFLSQKGGRISRNAVWRIVDKWGACAGIPKGKRRPHVLRHSRLTSLLEDGADLATVQTVAGHANLKTTSVYLHVARGHVDEQVLRSTL